MSDNPNNTDNTDNNDTILTTLDNPYNPYTQWNEWYAFDTQKGYHTCSYLARITKTSNDLSEVDDSLAIERAINEIIRLDILGLYVKVTRATWKDRSKEVPKDIV